MKKYFTTGLIAIIPVLILAWAVQLVYEFISVFVGQWTWATLVTGALIAFAGVFALGAALIHSKTLRSVKEKIETQIIDKTPLAKTVYKFSKDIAENALDDKIYDKVVRAYPFGRNGASLLGFLTNEKYNTVFIPSSPNPLSGQTYTGCEYDVLEDWTYDDVVKYDLSVGMSQKS